MSGPPEEACLANIGSAGVARRRTVAAVTLVATVAAVTALDLTDAPYRWRMLGVVPLWFAALCWLQAAART